jgi:aspartate/methionine/tyrosine aminotransferase
MADYSAWGFDGDAAAFTKHLIVEVGVATVPGPAFYLGHPELGEGLVRLAFAKTEETLDRVAERLRCGFEAWRP